MRAHGLVSLVLGSGWVLGCSAPGNPDPAPWSYFVADVGASTTPVDSGRATLPPTPPPVPTDAGADVPLGTAAPFAPVTAAKAPPPAISGGTLLIAREGIAVASDPERDRVSIVALVAGARPTTIALGSGDEPGRAVEDAARRVHVVLRSGGAIATIDLATRTLVGRTSVCPAPRGIAYEPSQDTIVVACAGGELVALGAQTRAPLWSRAYDDDLRDVVVRGTTLSVTRFRSAEILEVELDGTLRARRKLPALEGTAAASAFFRTVSAPGLTAGAPYRFEANVAWRARAIGDGVLVVHQRSFAGPVGAPPGDAGPDAPADANEVVTDTATDTPTDVATDGATDAAEAGRPIYYGSSESLTFPICDPVVQTTISLVQASTVVRGPTLLRAVVPVDFAATASGQTIAVVAAGITHSTVRAHLVMLRGEEWRNAGTTCNDTLGRTLSGEPTAVAFDQRFRVVVQSRQPAQLEIIDDRISDPDPTIVLSLEGDDRTDTGHALFHAAGRSGIACASCHPEGADDGRTWDFVGQGKRRTHDLRGGLLETAPFHWAGDVPDMSALMRDVFEGRMRSFVTTTAQQAALGSWLDHLRHPSRSLASADAVARGESAFQTTLGCASCHAGPRLWSAARVDMDAGFRLDVPSLVGVGLRAPYLHDGCAPTLRDVFGRCARGPHGIASALPAGELADLLAFLSSR